jgi:hypothetical protein
MSPRACVVVRAEIRNGSRSVLGQKTRRNVSLKLILEIAAALSTAPRQTAAALDGGDDSVIGVVHSDASQGALHKPAMGLPSAADSGTLMPVFDHARRTHSAMKLAGFGMLGRDAARVIVTV